MPRKQLIGVVVSDKMSKTVVVKVTRVVSHPVYRKVMNRFQKYKVHDEKAAAHIGDEVRIEETRPISKDKRWRLVEVVKKFTGDVKELEAVS
jgi:small subunit ribosomal protein S17